MEPNLKHSVLPETKSEETPESFIIQNITLGYHFVSDIGLQFSPRQVVDLTWEDQKVIKNSNNLKESLRNGVLRQLSESEYQKTMQMQYEREKKQLLKEQQKKQQIKYTTKKDGNKEFLAETFDVDKASRKNNELDVTGMANHPMSYVAAFEIAQKIAEDGGDELTAEEFSTMVEKNPKVIASLLAQTRTANLSPKNNVYYASSDNGNTNVIRTTMKNYNKELSYGNSNEDDNYISERIMSQLDLQDAVDDDTDYQGIDLNINGTFEDEDGAEEIIIEDEE